MKEWLDKMRTAYVALTDKKYTTIAGTLVFFLVMSVVPFTFLLTLLFGRFTDGFRELVGLEIFSEVRELLLLLEENARQAQRGATVVLALTSFYSASNFFFHLRKSGEIVYGCSRRRGGWRIRLSAVIASVATMFFLILFFAVFLGVVWFFRLYYAVYADLVGYIALAAFAFAVCLLFNLYIAPYRVPVRKMLSGSLLTTVLWGLASVGFSVWRRLGNMDKLYGRVSAIVVFLLWLYLLMTCFLIGVVFNEYNLKKWERRKERLPLCVRRNIL